MMGGLPKSEADRLTLWEFGGMRWHWNERHKSDEERNRVEPPTVEEVEAAQAELVELGIAGRKVS